jgi:hypothetical protein
VESPCDKEIAFFTDGLGALRHTSWEWRTGDAVGNHVPVCVVPGGGRYLRDKAGYGVTLVALGAFVIWLGYGMLRF